MRWISKIAVATMCVVFVTPHSGAMARCSFSPYEFFPDRNDHVRVLVQTDMESFCDLASMLVARPFSSFAQREERGPSRLEEQIPLRTPEERTPLRRPEERTPLLRPEEHTPPRTQTFGGHVYNGQLAWRDGRWHHTTRNGRDGWWWDVGGFWYFYPQQIEGPPDYVSDVEVADDATAAPSPAAPAPTEESNYAVYYRPGDLTGTRYQTLEECLQAREQAGNVGECIFK